MYLCVPTVAHWTCSCQGCLGACGHLPGIVSYWELYTTSQSDGLWGVVDSNPSQIISFVVDVTRKRRVKRYSCIASIPLIYQQLVQIIIIHYDQNVSQNDATHVYRFLFELVRFQSEVVVANIRLRLFGLWCNWLRGLTLECTQLNNTVNHFLPR